MEPEEIKEQDQLLEDGVVGPEIEAVDQQYENAKLKWIHAQIIEFQARLAVKIVDFELLTGRKIDSICVQRTSYKGLSYAEDCPEVLKNRLDYVNVRLMKEGE